MHIVIKFLTTQIGSGRKSSIKELERDGTNGKGQSSTTLYHSKKKVKFRINF